MKKIISFIIFLTYNYSFAQDIPSPATPNKENEQIIDKILINTEYENFLKEYVYSKIDKSEIAANWTSEYKKRILSSVKLKYFEFSLKNQLAFASKEELDKLNSGFKIYNENNNQKLVFINAIILNNLEIFAESIIEGKYIE
ncbi:hypothetical protein IF128_13065 [Empedobacter stercoris]|uniref:DUF3887 domain-containing protein n=1 Tax=Empedobacter stercoris TaxID=1628248 RepID=A0ABX1WPY3_9FLAO|nr:hypothetical protein [Empedobacter stercoris]MCA4810656.1 hypothetical protein [Empedobacter stercoris]NOJ76662.1 hypothetical protein [Empedobacter stercoris]QNT14948.1 hypothetical protein HNV03_09915 [Empedobacter stercoris]